MKIKLKLSDSATMPIRKTEGASGYDLCASEPEKVWPFSTVVIKTGVSLELEQGQEAQVRPRSGLSAKGIFVMLGTIDADYRGEIGVIIHNSTCNAFKVEKGDRIAQLVFAQVLASELVQVEELGTTERGENGFGSTGK